MRELPLHPSGNSKDISRLPRLHKKKRKSRCQCIVQLSKPFGGCPHNRFMPLRSYNLHRDKASCCFEVPLNSSLLLRRAINFCSSIHKSTLYIQLMYLDRLEYNSRLSARDLRWRFKYSQASSLVLSLSLASTKRLSTQQLKWNLSTSFSRHTKSERGHNKYTSWSYSKNSSRHVFIKDVYYVFIKIRW